MEEGLARGRPSEPADRVMLQAEAAQSHSWRWQGASHHRADINHCRVRRAGRIHPCWKKPPAPFYTHPEQGGVQNTAQNIKRCAWGWLHCQASSSKLQFLCLQNGMHKTCCAGGLTPGPTAWLPVLVNLLPWDVAMLTCLYFACGWAATQSRPIAVETTWATDLKYLLSGLWRRVC